MYMQLKRAVFTAAAVAGLAVVGAGSALASTPPASGSVSGSVSVVSSLSLTITSPGTFTFPQSTAGSPVTAPQAITYVAASDDPAGVTLSEMATDFSDGHGHSIPAADMTGSGTGSTGGGAPWTVNWTAANPPGGALVWATAGPGATNFSESLTLAIPVSTLPGTFSSTITELLVAN